MTQHDGLLYAVAASHVGHVKAAAAPVVAHSLTGRLYLSHSGWLLLTVPNSLVRGAFDALHEAGAELPLKSSGVLKSHISVMRPDEVDKIGGPDKINERGHQFHYTLGPLKEVEPKGWDEMSRVWFIEVKSPELRKLRTSYGLSPLPNGDHEFHITVAVRRKRVLQANDVKKAGHYWLPSKGPEENPPESYDQAEPVTQISNVFGEPYTPNYGAPPTQGTPSGVQPPASAMLGTANPGAVNDMTRRITTQTDPTGSTSKLGGLAWRCETCGERFSDDPPASKCPKCSGDSVPEDSYLEKNDRKLKKLRAFIGKFSDEELDGIRVDYHPDKPQMVWVDVMDWGDGKIGDQIVNAAKRIVGEENVTVVNEGGAPTRDRNGRKGGGGDYQSPGAKGWVAVKRAGVLFPLLRAGGLVTDVAGLRAIAGKEKDRGPDPADLIEADNSYLNQLRPKKKKRPVSVTLPVGMPLVPPKLAAIAKMIPMEGHEQETDYSCGPASLKIVEDHYGEDKSEETLRKEMDADPNAGTKPEELVHQARRDGLQSTLRENMSLDDLRRKIDSGEPTIINLQAWGSGDKQDYKKDESGHYVTLTGYDDRYFYFKDPVLGEQQGKMTPEQLDARWHDEEGDGDKTDHLGIAVDKPGDTKPPVIKKAPQADKIASAVHLLKYAKDGKEVVRIPMHPTAKLTKKKRRRRGIPRALAAAVGLADA